VKNKFQFLTYSGFYITTSEDYRILIDPFLDDNDAVSIKSTDFIRVDLILATHGAYDHVGDTAKIALAHKAWVICPDDVKILLIDQGLPAEQIIASTWGMTVAVGKIRVKPVENHHRSNVTLSDGRIVACNPLAFIIYLEDGTRVYVAGDTAIFSDMKLQAELYRPHIGLINAVTDLVETKPDPERPHIIMGEMSPYEAALASNWLGLEIAIACHYKSLKNCQLKEYLTIMEQMCADGVSPTKAVALNAGEVYEYSAKG
jgi:L-ascorbate metabolism protein UlaG (beta-lactamase superfamily)